MMFDQEYLAKMVPENEIYHRIECLRYEMCRREILAALLVSRISYFYLTGSSQNAILYVPLEEEPLLLVKRDVDRAREESPLSKVVQYKSLKDVPDMIKGHVKALPAIVGTEMEVIPARDFCYIEKLFKGVRFVNVSPALMKCRMRKSTFELEQMRKASCIAGKVFEKGRSLLVPGMTEIEFAASLELEAKRLGHEGLIRMRGLNCEGYSWHVLSGPSGGMVSDADTPSGGCGLSPAFPMGAGWRRIRANEPVMVDFPICYNGYIADQTRMFCIGKLPDKFRRAYDFCRETVGRVMEKARPGVECEEVYKASERMAGESGFESGFLGSPGRKSRFLGHGLGLEVNENPVLGAGQCYPVEAGVVVAVEPKVVFPGEGVVGIENMYRITEDGYERLTFIDEGVFEV